MEMMHTRHISSLLLLAAATALPAAAQYDQDINVEGKYVPEYIQHDRIGIFPRPIRFEAAKSSLSYSLGGVNADFTPQALPLQATGWRTARRMSAPHPPLGARRASAAQLHVAVAAEAVGVYP